MSFAELGVPGELVAALAALDIREPFPIQALAIPLAREGRDVCGRAKTGSGKTLAFGLPLLERLKPARIFHPRALILVPTRELALQVAEALDPLGEALELWVRAIYGGAPIPKQIAELREGAEVLVATPGRLIDLIERGDVYLDEIEVAVLDEADRMSDLGFTPQVEWILRLLPIERQTMLFSATLDGDVDHIVQRYLRNPAYVDVASDRPTVEGMLHRFIHVHQMDKVKVTAAIAGHAQRCLVFVRTKRTADRLTAALREEGVKAAAIHGDLRQNMRERALHDFQAGRRPVLVATDVAARGIHIDDVDVVIHYDPPEDQKAYLHRSGRTARAGDTGVAVTLVLWNQMESTKRIQRRLGLSVPIVEMFSNDPRLADLESWDPEGEAA